eukprot:6479379-Amphidinium_carterae.2
MCGMLRHGHSIICTIHANWVTMGRSHRAGCLCKGHASLPHLPRIAQAIDRSRPPFLIQIHGFRQCPKSLSFTSSCLDFIGHRVLLFSCVRSEGLWRVIQKSSITLSVATMEVEHQMRYRHHSVKDVQLFWKCEGKRANRILTMLCAPIHRDDTLAQIRSPSMFYYWRSVVPRTCRGIGSPMRRLHVVEVKRVRVHVYEKGREGFTRISSFEGDCQNMLNQTATILQHMGLYFCAFLHVWPHLHVRVSH